MSLKEERDHYKVASKSGRILFSVSREALRESTDLRQHEDPAVLVWSDMMKKDIFDQLLPFQVINRIPWCKTMCRKAPFVRLIHRLMAFFPNLITFLPKSYILPNDLEKFLIDRRESQKMYIYKPDKGSLGSGIRLVRPEDQFAASGRLAVAQEYIESYTIDSKKFDLRIYALIISLEPLTIYINRGGVARFCTKSINEEETQFSFLTNTAVNSKNPESVPEEMTRMVSDIFPQLQANGIDTEKLWKRIDDAIVLTIISGIGYLKKEAERQCPSFGYSRCFQIIGCDVLLDKDCNPYILEINYRPSLKCNTQQAKNLKITMLKDAIRLGAPYSVIQHLVDSEELPINDFDRLKSYMDGHSNIKKMIQKELSLAEKGNTFVKVFPSSTQSFYDVVYNTVLKMNTDIESGPNMPTEFKETVKPTLTKEETRILTNFLKEIRPELFPELKAERKKMKRASRKIKTPSIQKPDLKTNRRMGSSRRYDKSNQTNHKI